MRGGRAIAPATLEMRERAAHPAVPLTGDRDEPPTLYLGWEGPARVVAAQAALAAEALEGLGAAPLPDADAERFWRERHDIGNAFAAGDHEPMAGSPPGASFEFFQIALPPPRVRDLDARAQDRIARERLHCWERGVWVDDALYSLTVVDPATAGPDPGRMARFRRSTPRDRSIRGRRG